jgi:hypothetical protein
MISFAKLDIARLVEWAETHSSHWNGKDSGIEEDVAMVALEIIDTCNELRGHLEAIEDLINNERYNY